MMPSETEGSEATGDQVAELPGHDVGPADNVPQHGLLDDHEEPVVAFTQQPQAVGPDGRGLVCVVGQVHDGPRWPAESPLV